jgi:site-specific recombinase XerD
MNEPQNPIQTVSENNRLLTAADFLRLSEVPPEVEWFANLTNRCTRRAYQNAIHDFMALTGIQQAGRVPQRDPGACDRLRDALGNRLLNGTTIRHRLSALSSLFDYLCEKNAVTHNPVKGVKRPKHDSLEGRTPALGDHQARKLLEAPDGDSLRTLRDKAILATLLYHALRREELCKLTVKDFTHQRRGVPHLKVSGKGGKTRYVPLHPAAGGLIHDYLERAGAMETTRPGRCSGRSVIMSEDPRKASRRMGCTSLSVRIPESSVLKSARTRSAPPPRPMRWTTRPISRRCRNGSVTRISRPRGFMITGRPGPRTARHSR